ncbi:hypothetical protein OSTOST_18284 [Ostertagia ostertagi]
MQFTRNRAGEQILDVQEDKQAEMYQVDEEIDAAETAEKERAAAAAGGRYCFQNRGDARQVDRRSDENTCRVTNLPQEMEEAELRELFAAIGRVVRVFIARDKITNQPKGFAFVTYEMREDAERAIAKLNGIRKHHMVLKVEWTRYVVRFLP